MYYGHWMWSEREELAFGQACPLSIVINTATFSF